MPKEYKFTRLDDVLEALNDDRHIKRADVRPSLLDATLWQSMVSLSGGYMPHNRSYSRRKRHAVDAACESARWANPEDGCQADRAPRGMRASLMGGYSFRYRGDTYEVVRMTVDEVVS